MYKPIMATVRKWRGKICLAFLFRVSLSNYTTKTNSYFSDGFHGEMSQYMIYKDGK